MSLANEERGSLVGAFIVVDGDEILSITQGGQVVRSPINDDFRATGRSTMGVKFVTPKDGDAVAVVARSVEAPDNGDEDGGDEGDPSTTPDPDADADASADAGAESPDQGSDATIDETPDGQLADSPPESEA
jgi:DNA gyrase subunit A